MRELFITPLNPLSRLRAPAASNMRLAPYIPLLISPHLAPPSLFKPRNLCALQMKEEFDPETFESANITLPSGPEGTQPLVDTDASTAAGLVVGLGKLGVDVGWLNYFDFGVLSLNASC